MPPTSSTFCNNTTSRPGVGNISGALQPSGSNHTEKAGGAIFGKPKGTLKPEATSFRKKGTGTMHLCEKSTNLRTNLLANVQKFQYKDGFKRPDVPKRDDKPIQGLVSDKNYIVANAVENILAAPKVRENAAVDYTKKKTYGRVPKYITKIKQEIDDEYQLIKDMQLEEEQQQEREK